MFPQANATHEGDKDLAPQGRGESDGPRPQLFI